MPPAARDETELRDAGPEIKPLEWSPVMLGRQEGGLEMGDGLYGYAPGFTDRTDAGPFLVCFVHRAPFPMGAYSFESRWPDVIPPGRWRVYFQIGWPYAGHPENRDDSRGFATRAEAVGVAEAWWKAAVRQWLEIVNCEFRIGKDGRNLTGPEACNPSSP